MLPDSDSFVDFGDGFTPSKASTALVDGLVIKIGDMQALRDDILLGGVTGEAGDLGTGREKFSIERERRKHDVEDPGELRLEL